jgi:8-oxo-dGTP pyrophosphatase MutT (NUDIX family)
VTGSQKRDPTFSIPNERLPPGFLESLERAPAQVAVARPAATIVLLREGDASLEVLLLERQKSAGFVPGAWVFPGGRVDGHDADASLVARLQGITAAQASRRLGLADQSDPPALAFYVAAIREAFEETGILVARDAQGRPARGAIEDAEVEQLREALLQNDDVFPSVLDSLGVRMDCASVEYVAHWITPVVEPRRYDTRFFAAAVPAGVDAVPNEREMTRALWVTPTEALRMNLAGELPMVFPTIRTLQSLLGFATPRDALAAFREREIATILPRLVRTATGVGLEVDGEE